MYGIWSVPVSGGDEKPVPELSRAGYWRSWGIARDGLYFVTNGHSTGFVLKLFDFARRKVADLIVPWKRSRYGSEQVSVFRRTASPCCTHNRTK